MSLQKEMSSGARIFSHQQVKKRIFLRAEGGRHERLWGRDCPLLFLAQVFSLQPQTSKWNTFDLSLLDLSWELCMRFIMSRILRRSCASSCYPPLPGTCLGNTHRVSAKAQSGQETQQAAAPDWQVAACFLQGDEPGWKLESHHLPFTGVEGESDQRYS